MIKNIKVFGERNSGTVYLLELLQSNLKNINIFRPNTYKCDTGWKHGFPIINLFNTENTMFIVVFRNLKDWLNSMFRTPYHLKNNIIKSYENFNKFISNDLKNIINCHKNHIIIKDKREHNGNLFQIRYKKYNALYKLKKYNTVFINLEYIQKNPKEFIEKICDFYKLNKKEEFTKIIRHTKTKQLNIQNRNSKFKINNNNLKKFKDIKIENNINNLTIQMNKI